MGKNKDGRGAPGHFFIVPNEIITRYSKRIGLLGIHIYCYLKMRANKSSICYPSVDLIASEIGISRRSIFYALTTLVAAGLIERLKRGRFRMLNGDLFDNVLDAEKVQPVALSKNEKVH